MLGKPLLIFSPLKEGRLLRRYKRFLADVELDTGETVTAHCANTGPMKGVIAPGCRVRLRYAASPKRKLDWSWEQVEVKTLEGESCWVGINTSLANTLVREAIEAGVLSKELGPIDLIRPEVTYGLNRRSRIDFLLEPKSKQDKKIYLEVKNTTWTKGSLALFPDTVTERGQKHLRELMGVLPQSRAILIPCISRNDVNTFAPGDDADRIYGQLFRLAVDSGVEVIPCRFGFYPNQITWEGKISFKPFQAMAN